MADINRPFQHWKSDNKVLNQYFESVVANYKKYDGAKALTQIYKSHALYKQAIFGDCHGDIPDNSTNKSKEYQKWKYWDSLRGMSQEMAKRRFITYLAEINPSIIDVVPCEEPPIGFPKTSDGLQICAKCNTKVGCNRPLYDNKKFQLKEQLFENEEFSKNPDVLRQWTLNALETQRCIWGLHKPISVYIAKQFESWFNRIENKGYVPYLTSEKINTMLKDFVYYHYQLAFDMMQHRDEYSPEEYNEQANKALKLKETYNEISGLEFHFLVPCSLDTEACNLRRKADKGVNHTHEVSIDLPTKINTTSYADAIRLRNECEELGIDPSTGIITSIEQRCELLRQKIVDYNAKMTKVSAAKNRLLARPLVHGQEKRAIKQLHDKITQGQVKQVCDAGDVHKLLRAIQRGGNATQESTERGITPLLCLVLNNAVVEDFEQLVKYKVNFNTLTKFGLSPLIIACILSEAKLLHCLLKNGASHAYSDIHKRTPLHWCVMQSFEEGISVLLSYVSAAGGNIKEYLNMADKNGETALFAACKCRNGLMCNILCGLGADFLKKNLEGKTVTMVAQERNYVEIVEWLGKRKGAGVAKLESQQDLQFENMMRFGAMKGSECVVSLFTAYAKHVALDSEHMWFINAAHCKRESYLHRHVISQQQLKFVNRQYDLLHAKGDILLGLRLMMESLLEDIKAGKCTPNLIVSVRLYSFTPLLCSVLLNDVRLSRSLIKEGAQIDFCNVHGTTALMLAGWLNHVDLLVELLELGADYTKHDNEGFSASVYAGLLPTPDTLQQNCLNVSLGGDMHAVKILTTADIFVMVNKDGTSQLRGKMEQNKQMYRAARFKALGLDGKNDNTDNIAEENIDVQGELNNLYRFLDLQANTLTRSNGVLSKEDERTNILLLENTAERAGELALKPTVYRCDLCTLIIPCSHFPSLENYVRRLQSSQQITVARSNSNDNVTALTTSMPLIVSAVPKTKLSSYAAELKASKLFSKKTDEILVEMDLADRKMDRNLLMVNEYRDRIREALKPRSNLAQITYDLRPMSPLRAIISGFSTPADMPDTDTIDGLIIHNRSLDNEENDEVEREDSSTAETSPSTLDTTDFHPLSRNHSAKARSSIVLPPIVPLKSSMRTASRAARRTNMRVRFTLATDDPLLSEALVVKQP